MARMSNPRQEILTQTIRTPGRKRRRRDPRRQRQRNRKQHDFMPRHQAHKHAQHGANTARSAYPNRLRFQSL